MYFESMYHGVHQPVKVNTARSGRAHEWFLRATIIAATLAVLTSADVAGGEPDNPSDAKRADAAASPHFTNYSEAHRVARLSGKPMLVILNPDKQSAKNSISLDYLRRTRQRRELLQDYVILIVDTKTPHGQICHGLFGSHPLPRVAVIDKYQGYLTYESSERMYGQLLTDVLQAHRSGELPTMQVATQSEVEVESEPTSQQQTPQQEPQTAQAPCRRY